MPRRVLAALLLALALPTATAGAAVRPWPTGALTYHDAPASPAVRDAAALWNASGVRVRIVRARSAARADIRVFHRPGLRCAGVAQLGWVPGRQAKVALYDCPRWDLTLIAAHELGHVLGLDHERRSCALMNPVLLDGTPNRCERVAPWSYWCRVFEPLDLRRAARLYGGRPRVRPQATCPLFGRPAALGVLDAAVEDGELVARWTAPPRPRPLADTVLSRRLGHSGRLRLAVAPGPCPADLEALLDGAPAADVRVGWGADGELALGPAASPSCVAARVGDGPATAVEA